MAVEWVEDGDKLLAIYRPPAAKAPEAPQWFRAAVAEGLQILYATGLPRQPAAEMAKTTASVWIRLLWDAPIQWDVSDTARLKKTFAHLALTCEEWPTPKLVIKALFPRTPAPALPRPQISEEQRQINRKRAGKLLNTILKNIKT